MEKKNAGNSEALYGELGRLFNFTKGDLEANRLGLMTKRQRELRNSEYRQALKPFGILFGILSLMIFLPAGLVLIGNNEFSLLDKFLRFAYLVGLIGLPIFALFVWLSLGHFRDMRAGRVEKLVSRVNTKVHIATKGNLLFYLVTIGDDFSITKFQSQFDWGEQHYTIYYLPHGKTVLAIEVAQQGDTSSVKSAAKNALYGELGQAFNFTEEDLQANRAGFISQRQRTSQLWRLHNHNLEWLLGGVFFTGIGLAFFIFFRNFEPLLLCLLPMYTCFFLIGLIYFYAPLRSIWKYSQDIAAGKVIRVEYQEDDDDVRNVNFSFANEGKRMLLEDRRLYLLYILPNSEYILSMEETNEFFAKSDDKAAKNKGLVDRNLYGKALDFYNSDLADNRAGFMSRRQKRKQLEYYLRGIAIIGTIFDGPLLSFMIGCLIGMYLGEASHFSIFVILLVIALLIYGFVALKYHRVQNFFNFVRDMRNGRAQKFQGRIRPIHHKQDKFLEIDGESLEVVEIVGFAYDVQWKNERVYAVYATPHQKHLLSLEEVLPL